MWGYTTSTPNAYTYNYDALNRLTNATRSGTVMSEVIGYDDMGNIKTLKRDTNPITTYTYHNSGKSNRLLSLAGGLIGSYTYDGNGNAMTDRTELNFSYNQLNLPKTVSKAGTIVNYLYDATGIKHRKRAIISGDTIERYYIHNLEYNKDDNSSPKLERINIPDGYIQHAAGVYTYHYYLIDHLGNVRSVIKRGSGSTAVDVVQKQDYYAFGKTKSILTAGNNKYLYNGKEVQPELGDQLDYGARFYDAER
ncbi:hypothetical protein ACFRAE_17485 [Sphingobacterium sp. HJSM2_6]|uniref:hypothetical protein n=1 Tax=Sphingobacterium sp. HJSM2_6 TaxID=3366264 RepID=UPI003BBFE5EF